MSFMDGPLLKVLRGHADRVLCLFWDGDTLLSGSTDQTIKVGTRDPFNR